MALPRHDGAGQRIAFALELARQLFDRRGQHARAFARDVLAPAPDDALVAVADGMRHDDDWQAQLPCALARDLRERREGRADDCYGGYPEVLQLDRVTRGPGGRRASVPDAVDDGVALLCHLLRERRGYTQVGLTPEPYRRRAKVALEGERYTAQHDVGEFLAVVQDPDAPAANGGKPGRQGARRHRRVPGREVDADAGYGFLGCRHDSDASSKDQSAKSSVLKSVTLSACASCENSRSALARSRCAVSLRNFSSSSGRVSGLDGIPLKLLPSAVTSLPFFSFSVTRQSSAASLAARSSRSTLALFVSARIF